MIDSDPSDTGHAPHGPPRQTGTALVPLAVTPDGRESHQPERRDSERRGPERRRPEQAGTTSYVLTRPDPSFVTHLIATAAQMPQTRTLRRASPEDAESSYRSVADQNKPRPAPRPMGTSRVA
jgi:hypothetical protein